MEECLSIWKNLDTMVTTYQSNILSSRGCRTICIFPLLKSFSLLWSAFSVAARAKMPMHRSTDIIKLGLSVIFLFGFTWVLSNCNAKTTFLILRMQHVCSHLLIFFQPVYYVWQGLIFLEFKALSVCKSDNKCICRKHRPSLICLSGCSDNFAWIKLR